MKKKIKNERKANGEVDDNQDDDDKDKEPGQMNKRTENIMS